MKINSDVVQSITSSIALAAQKGAGLDYTDPNQIFQYVFTVMSIGASLVPIVGPAFGSIIVLLGQVLFPLHTQDVWASIRAPVEALVDQKVQDYHLKTLEAKVKGFQENMVAFTSVWQGYENAEPDIKDRQAEILRMHHTSFLSVVRTSIPDFQLEDYAVPALPWFAFAANIHITLLANGINDGVSWGYTDVFVQQTLRPEFDRKTGSVIATRADEPSGCSSNTCSSDQRKSELELLANAINAGESQHWSAELLDTWRTAYSALSVQRRGLLAERENENEDYPSYIHRQYTRGRSMVKPYPPGTNQAIENPGITEAAALRTYADYDAEMIMNVLTYAEFWPYLVHGRDMPISVQENLDREIFSGPYGRYTEQVPWTTSSPPPVTPRVANLTSFIVRAYDDIDGYRQKWGETWSAQYGSGTAGVAHQVDLRPDEFVKNIDVVFGHKLGSLRFTSNKGVYGTYGAAKNTAFSPTLDTPAYSLNASVNRTGYGMSSAYITHWTGATPPGCEGIFFGFRPLVLGGV
ncbi:Delta endotoxin [Akanthomyces lecanii RCEF 1005]|uniref:Delta endotoxin n=1 Tax=Akanthomyces lecanii RCEF 1005 TaxID=1081108 RepID=A0A168IBZ1_CORDF|nr:Delta endotoxin [Akanthomyces lecanii RCEF 1005]